MKMPENLVSQQAPLIIFSISRSETEASDTYESKTSSKSRLNLNKKN